MLSCILKFHFTIEPFNMNIYNHTLNLTLFCLMSSEHSGFPSIPVYWNAYFMCPVNFPIYGHLFFMQRWVDITNDPSRPQMCKEILQPFLEGLEKGGLKLERSIYWHYLIALNVFMICRWAFFEPSTPWISFQSTSGNNILWTSLFDPRSLDTWHPGVEPSILLIHPVSQSSLLYSYLALFAYNLRLDFHLITVSGI